MKLGLGLLVDLRPTDPSLAALAVDRRALLLDEEAPNQFLTIPPLLEWEGVVVMVIQSLLPKVGPVPLGIGRGGGHGHTQSSSQKLSLFPEWKRVVCWAGSDCPRGGGQLLRRRLCVTMTIAPSLIQKRKLYDHDHHRRAFAKKALYGHDHRPSPFQEEKAV